MTKEILQQLEDKMKKTVELIARDLTTLRAGRATPALLDKIFIDYYRYADTDQPGGYHLRA